METKQKFDLYEWCLGILDKTFLKKLTPLLRKYREVLLYLVFGVLTTVVSILSFALFNRAFRMNELWANVISWILAVTFAFFTNRLYVFDGAGTSASAFWKQFFSFYLGRLATLGVEELILYIFVTRMQLDSILIKVIASVVVIILNYVISKLIVFAKRGSGNKE